MVLTKNILVASRIEPTINGTFNVTILSVCLPFDSFGTNRYTLLGTNSTFPSSIQLTSSLTQDSLKQCKQLVKKNRKLAVLSNDYVKLYQQNYFSFWRKQNYSPVNIRSNLLKFRFGIWISKKFLWICKVE